MHNDRVYVGTSLLFAGRSLKTFLTRHFTISVDVKTVEVSGQRFIAKPYAKGPFPMIIKKMIKLSGFIVSHLRLTHYCLEYDSNAYGPIWHYLIGKRHNFFEKSV